MKKMLKVLLLLFILVSLGYIGFQQVKPSKPTVADAGKIINSPQSTVHIDERLALRAYYFHGTKRCKTCQKIESYSREAIQSAFAKTIADKKLDFVVVNVDQPGNEHFVEQFKLASSSLVLVQYHKGAQTAWKNLDQVWQLASEKPDFVRYVQAETQKMLGK